MSGMTSGLLVAYLALHATFARARVAVFRIDGPTPRGVRLIELSSTACIVIGAWLIAGRDTAGSAIDGLAVLLAAMSAGLFCWALRCIRSMQLSAAFSAELPQQLITQGPNRLVRNPFYLAYLPAHAVPWAASQSLAAVPGLLLMGAIYHRAALQEERKFMASPLAQEWSRYRQRTGRLLPRWRSGIGTKRNFPP